MESLKPLFMQQKVFSILSRTPEEETSGVQISFSRFMEYLQEKVYAEQTLRIKLYEFILRQFSKHPELARPLRLKDLQHYSELLDLLYACLFPLLSNEQETYWALSAPNSDAVFYSTQAFYKLVSPDNPNGMYATASQEEKAAFYTSMEQVKWALILERIYHIQPVIEEDIVYVWTDKRNGLTCYFSINIDNRFVEVHSPVAVEDADREMVQQQLKGVKKICDMKDAIAVSDFSFEGFSIITATDITARYAVHKMRSAIIRHTPENFDQTYQHILSLLKSLFGRGDARFGLIPFLRLNNRLVSYFESYAYSIMIDVAKREKIPEHYFISWLNMYARDPSVCQYNNSELKEQKGEVIARAFEKAGVNDYTLLPVHYNNELVGVLEVGAAGAGTLDEKHLSRLDVAMPILAQLMYTNQYEFSAGIYKIINTNFTSIQPAVQWRFNEAAWNYLKGRAEKGIAVEVEAIRFHEVFPLYGSVDIRNSTVERNNALYKDMQFYFTFLWETLQAMQTGAREKINELLSEATGLQQQMNLYLSSNEEAIINGFTEKINAFLQAAGREHPGDQAIKKYFEEIDTETGSLHKHRRSLEQSIKIINSSINKYLELMQAEFQRTYPVYFERFRTDGIEYDLYIGQSIAPEQPYRSAYLHKLRQWQLTSMAGIAKLVHLNTPLMPMRLHTTQLIYVNAAPISIGFRIDEKRFDVEGGYNTRYQIIKKRIDKVHIKDTGERLTQPGKIAIVYSKYGFFDEYMAYIRQLQREKLLQPEVEELELEELQGVSGLKALRVSVVMD